MYRKCAHPVESRMGRSCEDNLLPRVATPATPPLPGESASAFSAQWYRRSGTVVLSRVWSSVCERSDHA